MNERKYYIDNLRWLWIVFLIPFHAAMAWNCWEGNYIWLAENKVLSSLVIFIAPWYMPLLFVLAGMSTRYAMKRRSYRQFAVERVKKLLIPFITGIFTVVALMTYLADKIHNDYTGSFFEHYKIFFTHVTDLTGYDGAFTPAHLWFLLFLFIISMLSLLVIVLQKKIWPRLSFANIKTLFLPAFMLLPLVMNPILNFGGKSIGGDFALFLLGYYILSEEEVLVRMTKYRYLYLAIMLVFDIMLTYSFVWRGTQNGIEVTVCNLFAAWFGILGFLGLSRCIFNQNNSFTRYMSSRSFMIYIFHFGWLVAFQYYLYNMIRTVVVLYLVSVVGTIVMTLITCEFIKRIPGIRFLFGERKKVNKL